MTYYPRTISFQTLSPTRFQSETYMLTTPSRYAAPSFQVISNSLISSLSFFEAVPFCLSLAMAINSVGLSASLKVHKKSLMSKSANCNFCRKEGKYSRSILGTGVEKVQKYNNVIATGDESVLSGRFGSSTVFFNSRFRSPDANEGGSQPASYSKLKIDSEVEILRRTLLSSITKKRVPSLQGPGWESCKLLFQSSQPKTS